MPMGFFQFKEDYSEHLTNFTIWGVHITYYNWLTKDKLPRGIQALLGYLFIRRILIEPREEFAVLSWEENH